MEQQANQPERSSATTDGSASNIMGHPANSVDCPEYTILTPMRTSTNQMSAAQEQQQQQQQPSKQQQQEQERQLQEGQEPHQEQHQEQQQQQQEPHQEQQQEHQSHEHQHEQQQQQQQEPSQQEQQQALLHSATILTDLDATSVNQLQQQQLDTSSAGELTADGSLPSAPAAASSPPPPQPQQQPQPATTTTTANQANQHEQEHGSQQQHLDNSSQQSSLPANSIKIEPTSEQAASEQSSSSTSSNTSHCNATGATPPTGSDPLTELTPAVFQTSQLSDHHHLHQHQHHHQQQQQHQQHQIHQHQIHQHQLHQQHELLIESQPLQALQPLQPAHQQQQQVLTHQLIDSDGGGLQQQAAAPAGGALCDSKAGVAVLGAAGTGSGPGSNTPTSAASGGQTGGGGGGKRRTWNQVNRNVNKTEIAKVYSQYGFRCFLETPISTCRRKEEDRITYINKGEFYGLSLEYIPDFQRPLRSAIVKTVVMLVFREEKPPEEDLKSWQFWHSRQHSAKQRILDADNKNHVNIINQIEEISLNAIAFYWNPIETRSAKLNVAIQCLSTDFSNQKGVKGLPLNLQIDIYDLFTETSTPVFRGYATLLSYCDKGAQRRSRDEERRALKRKLADSSSSNQTSNPSSVNNQLQNSASSTPTGGSGPGSGGVGKKFEDLYHKPNDRTEFYSMADLIRPPTLYSPSEDAILEGPKQPMSQSSGVSITPISATTPIPSIETLHYTPQAQAQAQAVPPSALPGNQQNQLQQQQPTSNPNSVISSGNTPQPLGRPPLPVVAPNQLNQVIGNHSQQATASYNLVPAPDYMQQQGHVNANSQQQQQQPQTQLTSGNTGNQQQQQSTAQQQQAGHGPMVGLTGAQQAQQQHLSQQHQQVMNQQQQHHHYHQMGNSLQASYGIMQTATSLDQQHQPQQYAILQGPPIAMVQQSHQQQQQQPQHHHQQQQQQQMVATSTAGSQHAGQLDSRSQQHQHLMMGGQASGMLQQQQQQQQMQQMQHQYQQQAMPVGVVGGPPVVGAPVATANSVVALGTGGTGAGPPFPKRSKLYPEERVLIYAKQADEKDFYPLHLQPPSLSGLVYAIEQKYKIDSTKVANIYKKSKKGIRVQMDDEMIRHYCNEDMVQLEVIQTSDSRLEITLVEL